MTGSEKEKLANDLINKGLDLAEENIKNIKTGFLTFKVENDFTEEEKSYIIKKLGECSISFAEIVEKNEIEPEYHKIGLIFNYFLDKTVEIFYKQYSGIDLNTVNFELLEIFDEYEVDVPFNIQRILHNRLLKIVNITKSLWDYMEDQDILIWNTPNGYQCFFILLVLWVLILHNRLISMMTARYLFF